MKIHESATQWKRIETLKGGALMCVHLTQKENTKMVDDVISVSSNGSHQGEDYVFDLGKTWIVIYDKVFNS